MMEQFNKAEDQYFLLKGQFVAGRITSGQFEARLKDLMVQDTQGRWWMLGADSGKWYIHDQQTWIPANPYALPPTPPPPPPPATSLFTKKRLVIGGIILGGLVFVFIGFLLVVGLVLPGMSTGNTGEDGVSSQQALQATQQALQTGFQQLTSAAQQEPSARPTPLPSESPPTLTPPTSQEPQTPEVTQTPQVLPADHWSTVDGAENLVVHPSWAKVKGVVRKNDTLVLTAQNTYNTVWNASGPHLKIKGDFGVATTIKSKTGDCVAISLYGALPEGEWWENTKRLDLTFSHGEVSVSMWDGSKAGELVKQTFHAASLSNVPQLGIRKNGGTLTILAEGAEIGQMPDQGLFASGVVYFGLNVCPANQLTVYNLSVEAKNPQDVTLE